MPGGDYRWYDKVLVGCVKCCACKIGGVTIVVPVDVKTAMRKGGCDFDGRY